MLIGGITIAILGAFTQVQVNTRYVGDKTLALVLAEAKMEEMMKYPGSIIALGTTTDYAVKTSNSFTVQTTDPGVVNQFRRTVDVTASGSLKNVLVTVQYRYSNGGYLGRVTLNCRRGG